MCATKSDQLREVLPVELDQNSVIYNFKDPIIIGKHYPIIRIHEADSYGYIKRQACKGPLRITLLKKSSVFVTISCDECGFEIGASETQFNLKSDFFSAVDRWLINSITPGLVSCPQANLVLGSSLCLGSSALLLQPVPLVLIPTEHVEKHALIAFSRLTKELLRITKDASDNVRFTLGYR